MTDIDGGGRGEERDHCFGGRHCLLRTIHIIVHAAARPTRVEGAVHVPYTEWANLLCSGITPCGSSEAVICVDDTCSLMLNDASS